MGSIEEKRVYADREDPIDAYVASSVGVVRVSVAGTIVGEFSLCERCDARDVAATEGAVAIATGEDVRVLELGADAGEPSEDGAAFAGTGFGPAVAVGYDGGDLLAADGDGRVACKREGSDTWDDLTAETIGTVRAIDGDLLGTDSGVYRVHEGGLDHAGLTDVRDVSASGVPLAATADGLYKLGNGWMVISEQPFDVVAADPRADRGRLERAHAAAEGTLYAHDPADGGWRAVDDAPAAVVGVDYGETVYAVTEEGSFSVQTDSDEPGPWRSRTLGVTGVTGVAVPSPVDRSEETSN